MSELSSREKNRASVPKRKIIADVDDNDAAVSSSTQDLIQSNDVQPSHQDSLPPAQVPASKKSKLSARMAASFSAEHFASTINNVSPVDPPSPQPPTTDEGASSSIGAMTKPRKASRRTGSSSLSCPHCGIIAVTTNALGVHISVCEMAPLIIPAVAAIEEEAPVRPRSKQKASKSSSSSSASTLSSSLDVIASEYGAAVPAVGTSTETVERVVGSVMGRIVKKIEAAQGLVETRGDPHTSDGRHSNRGLDQRHVYTITEKVACIEYYDGLIAAGANVSAARIATKEHTKFPVETFRKWLTISERSKLLKERSEDEWKVTKDLKRVYPKNVRRERLIY